MNTASRLPGARGSPSGASHPLRAEETVITWQLIGGLLMSSVVSGLVPVVNAELLLVVATLAVSDGGAAIVAATVTVGQMLAKALLFFTARWAPARLPRKAHEALHKGAHKIEGRGAAVGALIGVSAIVGLPPFYVVTVASGALEVSPVLFLTLGTAGRAIRFGTMAWAATELGEAALGLFG